MLLYNGSLLGVGVGQVQLAVPNAILPHLGFLLLYFWFTFGFFLFCFPLKEKAETPCYGFENITKERTSDHIASLQAI